jgi:hypothetical protein
MKAISMKWVALGILVVALLLAGVVSYYASSEPDGLNRVAQDTGISRTEKQHPTADGPLAGYSTKDVDNQRLSGGLAGVAGVVVVLVLAGGLALVVRRRKPVS